MVANKLLNLQETCGAAPLGTKKSTSSDSPEGAGPVIRQVREHNELNGVVFSVVEFLLVAAAAAFVAFAFALHGDWLVAALVAGTALNALVVVAYGIAALRRGERGKSLRSLTRPEYRAAVRDEHPGLTRDTVTVTVTTLIPYILSIAVVAERLREGG